MHLVPRRCARPNRFEALGFFPAYFSEYGAGSKAGGARLTNGDGEMKFIVGRPGALA